MGFYDKYKTWIWVGLSVFIVVIVIVVLAVTGVFSKGSNNVQDDDDWIDADDMQDEGSGDATTTGGGGSTVSSPSPNPITTNSNATTSTHTSLASTSEQLEIQQPEELKANNLIVDSQTLNEDILSQSDVEGDEPEHKSVVETEDSSTLSTFIQTFDQVKIYKPETKIGNDVYKLSSLIQSIVYVHTRTSNGSDEKYTSLKSEIGKLDLDVSVNHIGIITQLPKHILPHQHTEKMLELEYLANMTALAKALQVKDKKMHLIVQSSFSFTVSPTDLYQKLKFVSSSLQDSWDVIYFAQDMLAWQKLNVGFSFQGKETLCRVLSGRHRKAYLIKSSYIRKLLLYYKNLYQSYLSEKQSPLNNVYQLQYELIQKTNTLENNDVWVGFRQPIGKIDRHKITYNETLTMQINETLFTTTEVKLLPSRVVYDVVAVIVTTTNNTGFVAKIVFNLKSHFLKGHRLHIVIATSRPLLFAGYHEPHTYVIPVKKYSDETDEDVYDTKFRFTYLLEVMSKLNSASPIKPNYWYLIHDQYNVYQHLSNEEMLQDGLIVAKYIDPVIVKDGYQINSKDPEDRTSSRAFIDRSKLIDIYSSDFIGGTTVEMEKLCRSIHDMMRKDISLGIMAKWKDESYLNKYLYTTNKDDNENNNVSRKVIQLSSIYSIRCFNSQCMDLYCQTKR